MIKKAMLAHKYDEKRIDWSEPVYIQPKLDGVRCLFTKDGAYSRAGNKDKIHVSCWNIYTNDCVFVLKPEKIISKYMVDGYEYTDFANNQTRSTQRDGTLDALNYAKKLVDILSQQY